MVGGGAAVVANSHKFAGEWDWWVVGIGGGAFALAVACALVIAWAVWRSR